MLRTLVVFLFSTLMLMAAPARAIDLDCETLAGKMVARLASEGLLLKTPGGEQRARGIALDSCKMAEGSAQQQLEASKKSWLNNWLLEDTGGKPGNKRLKNLKN